MTWFDFVLDHYIKVLIAVGSTLTVATALITLMVVRFWPLLKKTPACYRCVRNFFLKLGQAVDGFAALVEQVCGLSKLGEQFDQMAKKVDRIDAELTTGTPQYATILDVISANGGRLESIEHAVRQHGIILTLLIEEVDEAWVVTDAYGEPTFVSGHFTVMTGMTLTDMVGDGWHRMIHPEDLARVVGKWTHAKDTGAPFVELFRVRNVLPRKMSDGTLGDHPWFTVHNIAMAVRNNPNMPRNGWKSVFSRWSEHMNNSPFPTSPTNQAVTIHAGDGASPAPQDESSPR